MLPAGGSWDDVAAAPATTLSFTADYAMDGNQYRAMFTNAGGTVTTNAATLTVIPTATSAVTIDSATSSKGLITVEFSPSGTLLPTLFECNVGQRGSRVPCASGEAIRSAAKIVTVRGSTDGVTWVLSEPATVERVC